MLDPPEGGNQKHAHRYLPHSRRGSLSRSSSRPNKSPANQERIRSGIAAAKACGKKLGR
jgi:hypothetical protein